MKQKLLDFIAIGNYPMFQSFVDAQLNGCDTKTKIEVLNTVLSTIEGHAYLQYSYNFFKTELSKII